MSTLPRRAFAVSCAAMILTLAIPAPGITGDRAVHAARFVRGDTNNDSELDLSDAVSTLLALFGGAVTITCDDAADANDSGQVDISDPIFLLTYLFGAGVAPPSPFPNCGEDSTVDDLGCALFVPCNRAPIAVAGEDRLVVAGNRVDLDGRSSNDPDGNELSFDWRLVGRPDGSGAVLSGLLTPRTSFVPDVSGEYVAELIVGDGVDLSVPDSVVLTTDTAPTLEISGDTEVVVGRSIRLELIGADPEAQPLRYTVSPFPLPPNASLDARTGRFVFTPSPAQIGSVELVFSVRAGVLSASEALTIVVHPSAGDVTSLAGQLLDTNDFVEGTVTPIVDATVTLLESQVVVITDASGRFTLSDIGGGGRVLDIDCSTANPAPDGSGYAGFRERIVVFEGVENVIERPLFLPRLATSSLTFIDPATTTAVVNPELGIELTVAAGSARGEGGENFTGALSISEVPRGLAPAEMPDDFGPGLLVTIQPVGVTFSPPAPLTFPNIDGLAPGSETELWSLDPDTGTFVVVGTGRVSEDGRTIETISGGVRAADWHFVLPPRVGLEEDGDGDCDFQCCDQVSVGSEAGIAAGGLVVRHGLTEVPQRGWRAASRLVYKSNTASPRSIAAARVTIQQRAAVPRLVSARVEVGGVDQGGEIFTSTTGLSESRDEEILQSLQIDVGDFPTGVYPYRMRVTSHYERSTVGTSFSGRLLVNNRTGSRFGAGWGLHGFDRLEEQVNGGVVIVEGDGSIVLFDVSVSPEIVIHERGWSLSRSIEFPNGRAGHFNSLDGALYVARRDSGVYRVTMAGQSELIVDRDRPAALTVNPADGAVFVSEDYSGRIFRIPFEERRSDLWVAGFHPGDDDPIGIAIAPKNYSGPLLAEGDAVVVDRGFNGRDEIWRFSTLTPEGETVLHSDNGTLVDSLDVVISTDSIFVIDRNNSGEAGRIFRLIDSGVLIRLETSEPIGEPVGITLDPLTNDLLVLDHEQQRVLRIQPESGDVTEMFSGFQTSAQSWAAIDITPEGDRIFVTDEGRDVIDVFTRGILFRAQAGDSTRLTRQPDGSYIRTLREGASIHFDSDGLQTSRRDRADNVTEYRYEPDGRLSVIIDPEGGETHFTYDETGHLAEISDPASRITELDIDENGDLVRIADPDGTERRFHYDDSHKLVEQVSKRGFVTTYDYAPTGDYQHSTLPDGSHRRLNSSAQTGLVAPLSGRGSRKQPLPVLRPEDKLASYLDGNENETLYRSDRFGTSTETTDAKGSVTVTERDENGHVLHREFPDGQCVDTTYDSAGNTILQTFRAAGQCDLPPGDRDPELSRTRRYTFDESINYVTSITDTLGRATTFEYDDDGNRRFVIDRLDEIWEWRYDEFGREVMVIDPNGIEFETQYDKAGRVSAVVDAAGVEWLSTYDEAGNLATTTDGEGNAVSFEYDAIGQSVRTTDPGGLVTALDYDEGGNLVSVTNAIDETTRFEYDELDRVTRTVNPLGEDRRYSYDGEGNRVSLRGRNGQVTRFFYDELSRLVRKETPDNTVIYDYDINDNLTSVVDNDSEVTFVYDSFSQLVEARTEAISGQMATVIHYDYDSEGELVSMIDPSDGQTQYRRDAEGRLQQLETPGGHVFDFERDGSGQLARVKLPNGTLTQYANDDSGRLESIAHVFETTDEAFLGASYRFDRNGDRVEIIDLERTRTLRYGELGRLTGVLNGESVLESFLYDGVGNSRQSASVVLDAANRLREDDRFVYDYDGEGNLVERVEKSSDATTRLAWDAENRLTRVDLPDGGFASYRYDGLGRRIEKNLNDVISRFVYDGDNLLLELDAENEMRARFAHGDEVDEPLVMETVDGAFFFHRDGVGSILGLTDSSGVVVKTISYDAFGAIASETGDLVQPFAFTGREFDRETGLLFCRARYYDPISRRFLSEDPVYRDDLEPDTHSALVNLYTYVDNDPINFSDPYGMWRIHSSCKKAPFRGVMNPVLVRLAMFSVSRSINESNPFTSPCIKSERLRRKLKRRLKNLVIKCDRNPRRIDKNKALCGYAWVGSPALYITSDVLRVNCGTLASIIFHEMVHTVQKKVDEKQAYGCQISCFGSETLPPGNDGAGACADDCR